MRHGIFIGGNKAGRRLYPVLHGCSRNTHCVIDETGGFRHWNVDTVFVWTWMVIEPVVDLELYPCRSEQIQSIDCLEVFSSHQTLADQLGIRVQKIQFAPAGCNRIEWYVSSERCTGSSHSRYVRFGERAI